MQLPPLEPKRQAASSRRKFLRACGACEADLESSISMLLMTYLVGRPGFISDPVIDTAKNQIIYAHCVAPTRVFGPNGPGNPYHIRNHSEDRKGAVVRSLLPLGITVLPEG